MSQGVLVATVRHEEIMASREKRSSGSPRLAVRRRKSPRARRQKIDRPPSQVTPKALRFQALFRAFPPGLTYENIARRLGVSYEVARQWAIRFGYASKLRPRGRPSELAVHLKEIRRLPRDLTIAQVAEQLHVSYAVAGHWIRLTDYRFRRKPGSGLGSRKVDVSAWLEVDWSLNNAEIARRLHVSRERVRQVRELYAPAPPP